METSKNWMIVLGVVMGFGLSTSIVAGTCPMHLTQDKNGYWTSNDPPGWKSQLSSKTGITVSSTDFSGVVYSPQKKRLACVYKGHDAQQDDHWIAVLSNVYHPFNEDDLTGKNWEFNQQHKDYICGKPKSDLNSCEFRVS